MAKNHSIKILEFSESKINKSISVWVRGSDLLRAEFPNHPNIRSASNNKVVRGIVASIEENQGTYKFPEPIHISAKSFEKMRIGGTKNECLDLEFRSPSNNFVGDGIMNGGHRFKALQLCHTNGFNLDNVFVELKVYLGLTDQQIREKSKNLNTSQSPTKLSLMNYSGEFDWLKDLLPEDKYSVIYFENHSPNGVPSNQGYCFANRVIQLPGLINKEFYDINDPIAKNRHPFCLARSGNGVTNAQLRSVNYKKLYPLIPDLIQIQSWAGLAIQQSHNKKSLYPWIKETKKTTEYTHFPDGTILNVKLPNYVFTSPIISAFRPWLADDNTWILPLDQFGQWLATKLWTRYRELLTRSDYRWKATTSVLVYDSDLWDSLYKTSEELIEYKFNQMKNEVKTKTAAKTKRVA